jgi:hypothetical protein
MGFKQYSDVLAYYKSHNLLVILIAILYLLCINHSLIYSPCIIIQNVYKRTYIPGVELCYETAFYIENKEIQLFALQFYGKIVKMKIGEN